jgi:hypothetical protein
MTIRNRKCKVQVHALARVCTYSGIIRVCTCTKTAATSVTISYRLGSHFLTGPGKP